MTFRCLDVIALSKINIQLNDSMYTKTNQLQMRKTSIIIIIQAPIEQCEHLAAPGGRLCLLVHR